MSKRSKVPEGGYHMTETTRARYERGMYNAVLSQTRRMLDRAGVKHDLGELPGDRKKRKRAEAAAESGPQSDS